VAYLPLCPGQTVQVHVDLTVLPHSSVVVLEESPCPRGSSKTNFQVLVLGSQVFDNNTDFGLSCDSGLCYRAARRHSDVANVDRLLLAAATAEDDIYKLDIQSAATMRCRDIVELVGYSTGPPDLSADY